MSDELIRTLDKRLSESEARQAELNLAIRNAEVAEKRAKKELRVFQEKAAAEKAEAESLINELVTESDGWKAKAEASPVEQAARVRELEEAIHTRDHMDGWKEAVGKDLHPHTSIEKLWRDIEYKPGDKVPTREEINGLVASAKEKAGYHFVQPAPAGNAGNAQGAARPTLKVAESPGRGARDNASGQVSYSSSEVRQPGWMNTPRGKDIVEARTQGTAVLVD